MDRELGSIQVGRDQNTDTRDPRLRVAEKATNQAAVFAATFEDRNGNVISSSDAAKPSAVRVATSFGVHPSAHCAPTIAPMLEPADDVHGDAQFLERAEDAKVREAAGEPAAERQGDGLPGQARETIVMRLAVQPQVHMARHVPLLEPAARAGRHPVRRMDEGKGPPGVCRE